VGIRARGRDGGAQRVAARGERAQIEVCFVAHVDVRGAFEVRRRPGACRTDGRCHGRASSRVVDRFEDSVIESASDDEHGAVAGCDFGLVGPNNAQGCRIAADRQRLSQTQELAGRPIAAEHPHVVCAGGQARWRHEAINRFTFARAETRLVAKRHEAR